MSDEWKEWRKVLLPLTFAVGALYWGIRELVALYHAVVVMPVGRLAGKVVMGAAALLAVLLAFALWDALYTRWYRLRRDKLTLLRNRIESEERTYWPDQFGRLPLIKDQEGRFVNPDTYAAFEMDGLRGAHPELEAARYRHMLEVARAHADVPKSYHYEHIVDGSRTYEGTEGAPLDVPAALLPSRVDLRALLGGRPSLERLVLGVALDEAGAQETVTGSMSSLVHIAVGGSSGWGKSVFMQVLAWQLAMSREPVDLAAIDLEGTTLNVLHNSGRLLWPIADTPEDAVRVLQGLTAEIERRKALYNQAGAGVASLADYNDTAARLGVEPLRPCVLLFDEMTAMLSDKRVEEALKTTTLRARKYGVWTVLAGQDWKATSLDSAIKNQLSTRVQFRANSSAQSRVLLGVGDAADLRVQGRALLELPGKPRLMVQAPWVEPGAFRALEGSGPRHELPAVESSVTREEAAAVIDDDPDLLPEDRVWLLYEQGVSQSEIERRVFGFTGGSAYRQVKDILSQE